MPSMAVSLPQRVSTTSSDSCIMVLSASFMMDTVYIPSSCALRSAARVSAVSPDWDVKITPAFFSRSFLW